MAPPRDELSMTVDVSGLSDREIKHRIETLSSQAIKGGPDVSNLVSSFAAQARAAGDKLCWTRGGDTVCWTRGGALE
jgi:hypothetical protein